MIRTMRLWLGVPTRRATPWTSATVALGLTLMLASCGEGRSPTTPTPALDVTCPGTTSVVATSAAGAVVSYVPAVASGGSGQVTVSCTPAAGQLFPVGRTAVTCTARDGGNQLSACAFDVVVSAAPRLSRSRFLAFGDSITAGEVTVPMATPAGAYRLIVVPTASYPAILGSNLQRSYPVQTVSVVNAGQPGQAASAAVTRFTTAMAQQQPEAVLLLMGYNDLGSSAGANAAATALTAMVRDARGRGARVFLGTLTPTIPGRQRSMDQGLLDALNIRIRQIAVTENARLVDLYESMLAGVSAWIGVDGLHPNEAGYVRIADLFQEAIRADLEVR